MGASDGRATAVGGTAVYMALEKLKEKATKLAAHLLQTDAGKVTFNDGQFTVQGSSVSTSIQEVALAAHLARSLPPDMEPGLSATAVFEPKNFTFPFRTHVAVVEMYSSRGEL